MNLVYHDVTVRSAFIEDAPILTKWWNDGLIMAHAGFPDGSKETLEDVQTSLLKKCASISEILIIERNGVAIGEMSYHKRGHTVVEIGIKICDFQLHDKGYGKILLSMLITELFSTLHFHKIMLDTNVNNKRAQHVYEQLGFTLVGVRENAAKDQHNNAQSFVDYELIPSNFVSWIKDYM